MLLCELLFIGSMNINHSNDSNFHTRDQSALAAATHLQFLAALLPMNFPRDRTGWSAGLVLTSS